MLDYYIYKEGLASSSRKAETDIVIKNFAAVGAIMLLSSQSYFAPKLGAWAMFIAGAAIIFISLASRALSIFHHKHSSYLEKYSWLVEKAYLRDRDKDYIERRYRDASDGPSLLEMSVDVDRLTIREFFTYNSALSVINGIPALFFIMIMAVYFIRRLTLC